MSSKHIIKDKCHSCQQFKARSITIGSKTNTINNLCRKKKTKIKIHTKIKC